LYNVGIDQPNTKRSFEMTTKIKATTTAVEKSNYWMNGAVVVVDENGDYDAIPGAYLNDISYTGSRDVVVDLSNGLDDTGYSLDDATAEEIAKLLI
jgi:hypothetical protein